MSETENGDFRSVAVIGAGAAGMMAAVSALESGAAVTLYEQNPICGKKLRITGKGRCNLTNDCPPEEILKNVTRNEKFLFGSVYNFTSADVMELFESLGVPLKTERGRRVFPQSDRATDIAAALEKHLTALGGKIVHTKVMGISVKNGETAGVVTAQGERAHGAVIVATGGISYPGTGSRGDGHRFAREAGLSVTPLSASLVPVVLFENTADMMGLSLRNVRLSVFLGDKLVYSDMGEMLMTHFGVSGPLVLSASAHMQKSPVQSYRFEIDLKPALSDSELDSRLISDFKKYSARDFANSLGDLLPRAMIPEIIRRSGIPPHTKTGAITKEMRHSLLHALKHLSYSPKAFRPTDEAIITCGGVDVGELNPKTMMTKKIPGLFFAGEIIDVDAYTGGYNLQIAWSTGHRAGESAAEYLSGRSE